MKPYDNDRSLISIHIPRCAGTTFGFEVLQKWFGDRLFMHYYSEETATRPPKYGLKPGICIHGHFNGSRGFGVEDYYPEVEQLITILRDPFEVALSNYFRGKKMGDNRYRDGLIVRTRDQFRDVRDFLSQRRSYLLLYMPCEVTLGNFEAMFESQFVYVGIAEDVQTSVDMLAGKLGFSTVAVGRLNAAERDEEITSDLRETFVKRHPLEYAVYNWALANYRR